MSDKLPWIEFIAALKLIDADLRWDCDVVAFFQFWVVPNNDATNVKVYQYLASLGANPRMLSGSGHTSVGRRNLGQFVELPQ